MVTIVFLVLVQSFNDHVSHSLADVVPPDEMLWGWRRLGSARFGFISFQVKPVPDFSA